MGEVAVDDAPAVLAGGKVVVVAVLAEMKVGISGIIANPNSGVTVLALDGFLVPAIRAENFIADGEVILAADFAAAVAAVVGFVFVHSVSSLVFIS